MTIPSTITEATTGIRRTIAFDRSLTIWAGVIITIELTAVLGYLIFSNATITNPLILVYPFVWINVGLWAIATTTPAPSKRKNQRIAALLAVGYFLVLASVAGLINPGHALHGHGHTVGFRLAIASLPPGWGPAILYGGLWVNLSILPFTLVGYVSLAYLVYVTILDAAGSAMAGIVGLFSCVSCTWPVIGTIVTGLFGSTSAVALLATNQPYGLSTIVFLTSIGLLYWRPLR